MHSYRIAADTALPAGYGIVGKRTFAVVTLAGICRDPCFEMRKW